MEINMYSVFDSAVGAFITPFFITSDASAKRLFMLSCRDSTHMFHRAAQDYTLFRLGSWNDVDGTYQPLPESLMLGVEARSSGDVLTGSVPFSLTQCEE